MVDGQNHNPLSLRRDPILQIGLTAGKFLQRRFSVSLAKLLVVVEAVPAIAHDLAGLGDIPELPDRVRKANLRLIIFWSLVILRLLVRDTRLARDRQFAKPNNVRLKRSYSISKNPIVPSQNWTSADNIRRLVRPPQQVAS
jgi:hypothetical protein